MWSFQQHQVPSKSQRKRESSQEDQVEIEIEIIEIEIESYKESSEFRFPIDPLQEGIDDWHPYSHFLKDLGFENWSW